MPAPALPPVPPTTPPPRPAQPRPRNRKLRARSGTEPLHAPPRAGSISPPHHVPPTVSSRAGRTPRPTFARRRNAGSKTVPPPSPKVPPAPPTPATVAPAPRQRCRFGLPLLPLPAQGSCLRSHQCSVGVPPAVGPPPFPAAESDSRDGHPAISGAEVGLPRAPVGLAGGGRITRAERRVFPAPDSAARSATARRPEAYPTSGRRHTPRRAGGVPRAVGQERQRSGAPRDSQTKPCDADRPAYCPRRCAWKKRSVLAHASFVAATPAAVCKWANACGIPG